MIATRFAIDSPPDLDSPLNDEEDSTMAARPHPADLEAAPFLERTILHPDRESWLRARAAGIGASEIGAILGISPWADAMTVYLDKLGIAPEKDQTEAMEWGLRLEGPIARKYAEVTGRRVVDPGDYAIVECDPSEPAPFLSTLDRYIPSAPGKSGPGVLELKTANAMAEADWEEGPPAYYLAQLQQQLMVCGVAWGSLAVLIGGQRFLYIDVEADESVWEEIRTAGARFWEHVVRQERPAPGGSHRSGNVIAQLYPEDNGEAVALTGDFLEIDARLCQAKAQISEIEREKRELENLIKSAIGNAELGVLPNGVSYAWSTQRRKAYHVEASTYRVLRRRGA